VTRFATRAEVLSRAVLTGTGATAVGAVISVARDGWTRHIFWSASSAGVGAFIGMLVMPLLFGRRWRIKQTDQLPGGCMSPRLRCALGQGAIYGGALAVVRSVAGFFGHKGVSEMLIDVTAYGAFAFLVAFGTKFFFPSWGERRPRPPQNSN
jgi:hypothetical protein